MKKEIRLLIEGFFDDDLFNQKEDINQDIQDVGNQFYNYNIGDIYYKKKKPYAICCGIDLQFKDNRSRFCLLNFNKERRSKWSKNGVFVSFLGAHTYLDEKTNTVIQHIDENGYENTQIIKNTCDIHNYPAFNNCIKLGDNVYLPAIDELQIFYKNKMQDIIFKTTPKHKQWPYAWSSTQGKGIIAYVFELVHFPWQTTQISGSGKTDLNMIIPFVKID